jgi:tetratricopeptide (TPR) repeat protein
MVTSQGPALSGLLDEGVAHHQAGRLEAAEAIYRRVLAADGRCADAWNLLGVIAFQCDQHATAVNFIANAIRIDDRKPAFYSNFGNALLSLGHAAEAESSYSAALALDPRFVDALSNRGNALRALGRLEESEASYRASLRLRPKQAETHNNLGHTLEMLGREAEAEASFRKALRLQPD